MFGMVDMYDAYIADGFSPEQAAALTGRVVERDAVESVDAGIDGDALIELNADLAVRAINRALRSDKLDSVTIQAAIRAVAMYEDLKGEKVGDTAEDDMLRWVAERRAEELTKENVDG